MTLQKINSSKIVCCLKAIACLFACFGVWILDPIIRSPRAILAFKLTRWARNALLKNGRMPAKAVVSLAGPRRELEPAERPSALPTPAAESARAATRTGIGPKNYRAEMCRGGPRLGGAGSGARHAGSDVIATVTTSGYLFIAPEAASTPSPMMPPKITCRQPCFRRSTE